MYIVVTKVEDFIVTSVEINIYFAAVWCLVYFFLAIACGSHDAIA